MMIRSAGKKRSIPSYATHIFFARLASDLFVTPAYEFCSCIRHGMPMSAAALSVGAEAYPPTPTTTCGRNSFMIFFTLCLLRMKSIITPMFFGLHNGRISPRTGRPLISYPASGTRVISILPSAPMKSISASGCFALTAFAILMAGKICPPVPPPLIIIFMVIKCL